LTDTQNFAEEDAVTLFDFTPSLTADILIISRLNLGDEDVGASDINTSDQAESTSPGPTKPALMMRTSNWTNSTYSGGGVRIELYTIVTTNPYR